MRLPYLPTKENRQIHLHGLAVVTAFLSSSYSVKPKIQTNGLATTRTTYKLSSNYFHDKRIVADNIELSTPFILFISD